jgi:hypothetical protein
MYSPFCWAESSPPAYRQYRGRRSDFFSVVLIGTCLISRVLAATQREERVRERVKVASHTAG